jgi:hypothetical protein
MVQREALAYVAAHGDADDMSLPAVGVRSNELCDMPGRVVSRAWLDVPRRGMQWQVGEKDVEVREARKDERKLETARKAPVKKDNGRRLIVVP